jgi:hypothetical protein
MMTRKLIVAAAALGWAIILTPTYAAAGGDHVQRAIESTEKAIHAGKHHHSSSLVQHADNAIDHAMKAQKQEPNAHLKSAIAHLRSAIRTAKWTHSWRRDALAARHAQKALTNLEAVSQ